MRKSPPKPPTRPQKPKEMMDERAILEYVEDVEISISDIIEKYSQYSVEELF